MSAATARRYPASVARRVGYVIAIVVNAVLLVLVDVRPGWEAFPFLSPNAEEVVGLVNLSLVVGIVVNVIDLAADARGLRALGELVTSVITVVVAARVWQVFPFEVDATWQTLVRIGLGFAIVGASIGALAQVVTLVRLGATSPPAATPRP